MTISGAFMLGWLVVAGYGEPQRDAVLAAANGESGLRPGIVSRAGDRGLFQHNGPRRRALDAYELTRLPELRRDHPEFAEAERQATAQLEFMDSEWRAMPQSAGFFAAHTRAQAFRLFCRHYEKRRRCP